MDFKLSPKHQMLKKMFREFAEKELAPIAAEVDERNDFDMDSANKMSKAGFLGIPFPQKYCGGGADERAGAAGRSDDGGRRERLERAARREKAGIAGGSADERGADGIFLA